MAPRLILASGSPRRRELLRTMGFAHFTVCVPDIDEHLPGSAAPWSLVESLSRRKAAAVAAQYPDAVVIAADTVVCHGGRILGKPSSPDEAAEMLSTLSGRSHQVYTGVTVQQWDTIRTAHEKTTVFFRPLTALEIFRYIQSGEPMDKAGAYGIQGRGGLFVEKIQGDFFNVVGLPICLVGKLCLEFGLDPLAPDIAKNRSR